MSDTPVEEIEIVADDPEVVEPVVEEVASPEIDYQASLDELKQKLADAERAKQDAERREYEARNRETSARNETADTNLQLVENAIATVDQQIQILKQQYADALATADYGQAAEVQNAMSINAAKKIQLEQGRDSMKAAPKTQPVSDPVEALASQLTPRSAEWIRRNPQFAKDQRLYQKMVAAHNIAVADGIQPDTDDYFAEVEGILKIRQRNEPVEVEEPMQDTAKVVQRRVSPAAAPVTRTAPGSTNRPATVRLSAEEREMATMMKMTPEEYAKSKLALIKEGKMN